MAMRCFTVHLQRPELTLRGIARSQRHRLLDDSREVHEMSAPLSGYSVPVAGSASTGVFSFAASNSVLVRVPQSVPFPPVTHLLIECRRSLLMRDCRLPQSVRRSGCDWFGRCAKCGLACVVGFGRCRHDRRRGRLLSVSRCAGGY